MDELEPRVLQNLVRLRKASGLSQKQVEAKLELRANTLYDIEKGRLKLPFVMAVQLMNAYRADLNDLIAESSGNQDSLESEPQSVPSLEALGVIDGGVHPLAHVISQDPVIVAEVGLGELGKKPLMSLLNEKLTVSQQKYFVVDVYRYINSLISSDGEIRESELQLRDALIKQAQVVLTDSDKKSIARAFTKPHFGKSVVKGFPRDAFKHFLIWTLHMVARSQGKAHFKSSEYIRQVAEHIQLPFSAFRYIEEQVVEAYGEEV